MAHPLYWNTSALTVAIIPIQRHLAQQTLALLLALLNEVLTTLQAVPLSRQNLRFPVQSLHTTMQEIPSIMTKFSQQMDINGFLTLPIVVVEDTLPLVNRS